MENKIPIKSPSTASQIIDDEAVIIVPSEQMVNVLNPVGSRIWDLADGRKCIAEIAEILSHEFDISYETALKDAIEFTGDLAEKKVMGFAGEGKEKK
ncbi:MAG: PqqD family protein [Thermodesulfobacteriota bacterium]